MFLRVPSKQFEANCPRGGAANKRLLKNLVESGEEPGLLAYRGDLPVGWVAVAPRQQYGRVMRSPIHKPIDAETGVWAISCFFVDRGERGHGVADALLEAAVGYAGEQGARIVEAYPNDAGSRRPPASEMWRGSLDQFERAGFEVVGRRRPGRPIVRRRLGA